ncbi:nickel pincer cofactor biosynthesis protein LarC [Pseudonocardia sp. RS11V-5]|uniref:nickel pincer cofactor biosynthesis protein LarC n=1 Tax=Pseudonocardia terrae TaxID=2905831 RepID=UPI001E44F7EC|nr:nickel pincer cofactor biosynthesis protein LarC [Pseudonocardia terrae]MCE3552692.1 nickel pincer cofactor biosynthesis protein LarC [Pseudonocardia terrae]
MILWLNPVSGISGDMVLGALLELGAPIDGVRAAIASTGLTGWSLETRRVRRAGLAATHAEVRVDDDVPARRAAELRAMVARARPDAVATLAVAAVDALTEVETVLHGVPPEEVHLHEIGGVDTVVDTVGVAAALHLLDVGTVRSGPLGLGAGTVGGSHGVLPLPAPATAALLAKARAPVTSTGLPGESVTPTGIALLLAAGAEFGPVPTMTVQGVGYGAGSRDVPGRPNVLQALLGAHEPEGRRHEEMTVLETTVDDVSGEVLGHVLERLLGAGAADCWITPATMKKSRPGHVVHALVAAAHLEVCEEVLLRETGSLGARRVRVARRALPRHFSTVEVGGRSIRVKHGPWGAKPEHDDVAAAAAALGLTVREVADLARAAMARTG